MREEDKVAIAIAATNQNQQLALLSPLDEGCDCCCTLPLPRYRYIQGSDPSQTVSNLNLTSSQAAVGADWANLNQNG